LIASSISSIELLFSTFLPLLFPFLRCFCRSNPLVQPFPPSAMAIVRPYEPPPDYPLDERSSVYSNPVYRNPRVYSSPSTHSYDMIRTRQYPEIAGLSTQDRTPSLRSFTRGEGRDERSNHNNTRHQQRQWSSSSTSSFHDTPFCPSRLNPNLRQHSRAETDRNSQVSGRTSSGVASSPSPSPSLLLRSAVHSPLRPDSQQSSHYSKTLRKSCPDLNGTMAASREEERRRRRMKKREEREWAKKELPKWGLDDVILWLQEIGEEEIASLLIGYEIKGEEVAKWDERTLVRFGVEDVATRRKILSERDKLMKRKGGKERTSLFDIITRANGDQVVVVESPLTVRDLIVSRHSSGCLSIQKVAGSNLPLEGDDCLLEINSVPGEQFTSPLMLTKLISDSGGRPIRFVVLRRARLCVHPEEEITRDSSSGVSSSSPVHHSHEKLYS
ncbi:hypothetical protein PMAYCL1PPCAC_11773, partial [Pristionchus mayeri]